MCFHRFHEMEYSNEESSPVYITESCCICDEEFSSDADLADHLVNHVNDKEYKCILDDSYNNDSGTLPLTFTSGLRKTPLSKGKISNSVPGRSGSPEVWEIVSDDSDDESAKGAKCAKISNSFRLVSGTGKAQDQTIVPASKQKTLKNGKHKQNLKISSKPGTPLNCPQCSLAFKDHKLLQEHILNHEKPRPYTCQICNKYFAYKATLRQHLHQHIGEKSHECKICRKKFSIKSMLRKHEEMHEQQKIQDRIITTQLQRTR